MTIQLGDASSNAVFTDIVQQAQSLGSLNAANNMTLRGQSTATIKITGSSGTNTIVFQGSVDGTNYDTVVAYPLAGGPGITSVSGGTNGAWFIPVAGFNKFQALMSAFTSGSATVSVVASQGTQLPPTSAAGNAREDLIAWGGTILGTPTNFGTTPTAVVAGSVNASLFAGTTAVRTNQTTTASGVVDVNIVGLIGTTSVQASAGIPKVGITGNTGAAVDAALTGATPANAIQVGARVATSNPSNASNAALNVPMLDHATRYVVTLGQIRELIGVQQTNVAVNTETTIITAGGAGVFNDIAYLLITTAGAAAQTITIKDATAGTTRMVINYPPLTPVAVNAFLEPLTLIFPIPVPQAAANNNWTVTQSLATACNYTAIFLKNL